MFQVHRFIRNGDSDKAREKKHLVNHVRTKKILATGSVFLGKKILSNVTQFLTTAVFESVTASKQKEEIRVQWQSLVL